METTMFLSNTGLQIIQGTTSKQNIQIAYFQEYAFSEGTMLDGEIMDEHNVREILQTIKKAGIEETRLVIDSGRIIVKSAIAPKLKKKEMRQFVEDELLETKGQAEDLLYDYTVLGSRANNEGENVLCCAMEKKILEPYITIFKEEGIKLTSIDILTNSIIKLVNISNNLSNKTYVLTVVDDKDIKNYLFVKNEYILTSRSRVFSDRGSVAFVTELTNSLTKLMQFYKTNYKDETLSNIYFAGLDTV